METRNIIKYISLRLKRACSSKNNFCSRIPDGTGEVYYSKDVHQPAYDLQKGKKICFSGQPTPFTHPHLLKPGEITSGITREEYAARRYHLVDLLQNSLPKSKHHIIILPGSQRRYMIDKIPYLFRQDTDMLYLSGCLEPDCVLVIHSLPGNLLTSDHKTVMFTQPFDQSKELWDGPQTGPSGAVDVWGVDQGFQLSELPRYISSIEKELIEPNIWFNQFTQNNSETHKLLHDWMMRGRKGKLLSPVSFIHSLRSIKSAAEIELMRKACQISSEAIKDTIKNCMAPISEHQLFATVEYFCRLKGADYLAYPPVVAGGARTNIIHYINNNNIVCENDLVLMDAGGEYRGYSGDVTRTWPAMGVFTPAQRDLYEAVLDVQTYVIDNCSELPSLNQLFSLMCSRLGTVLQELCIIPKNLSETELSRAAYGFCPHHVSHYLGMDVHDTPSLSRSSALSPGCIITVEPGIYISEKNTAVDQRYLGLGIRIEDDILIGENGKVEILSRSCPTHPDDIEALVGSSL